MAGGRAVWYAIPLLLAVLPRGGDANAALPQPQWGANYTQPMVVVDVAGMGVGERLALAMLQGRVAQRAPALYLNTDDAAGQWLATARGTWGVTVRLTTQNFTAVFAEFLAHLDGYVLVDGADAATGAFDDANESPLVAITHCGAYRCVAADAAIAPLLRGLRLKQLEDFRGLTLAAYFERWPYALSGASARVAVLQRPSALPCLADYAVFAGAVAFWVPQFPGGNAAPSTRGVADDVIAHLTRPASDPTANAGGAVGVPTIVGWGPDEFNTVQTLSQAGVMLIAADHAYNLAVLTAFRVVPPAASPPPPPGVPRGQAAGTGGGRHKVAFVFTDGDNIQWLVSGGPSGFASAQYWGHPRRGCVPMTWTMSSALPQLSAPTFEHYMATATANDSFMAGVSGAGYYYPDQVPTAALRRMAAASAQARAAFAARVRGPPRRSVPQNVLAQNGCRNTTSARAIEACGITMDEVASSLAADVDVGGGDTLLHMPMENYCGLHGRAARVRGAGPHAPAEPTLILSPRYSLWSNANLPCFKPTPADLAAALAAQPTDPSTIAAYSVVMVLVWGHTPGDVCAVADALRAMDAPVDVVSFDELAAMVKANVKDI